MASPNPNLLFLSLLFTITALSFFSAASAMPCKTLLISSYTFSVKPLYPNPNSDDNNNHPSSSSGFLNGNLLRRSVDASSAPQRREPDVGKFDFGCDHYRRRCKIRAPCCQKIFPCRHCHNDTTSELSNPNDRHEIVRHDIKQVICSLCETEQQVAQVCTNCGVKMGEYFCDICKFYDDDTSKGQFHCEGCGICRVGDRDKFFHCDKCGSCYLVDLRNNHFCIENSMKNNCPVCYEYLFDSVRGAAVMKCGHTMHAHCLHQMTNQNQYRCPICSKTVIEEMSNWWSMLDQEIEAVQMPEEYRYEVSILCNDCNAISKTQFHIVSLQIIQYSKDQRGRVLTDQQYRIGAFALAGSGQWFYFGKIVILFSYDD